MDNVSYHSVHLDKVPNTASKKLTLEEFLRKQDVYFEDNYTKKQLWKYLAQENFLKNIKPTLLLQNLDTKSYGSHHIIASSIQLK
jgi:hypothetical protein